MIKRRYRLSGKDMFRIFQKPNHNLYRSVNLLGILYSKRNQRDMLRFAVVVSKKMGKAHVRNLIKRRLYNIIQHFILKSPTVLSPSESTMSAKLINTSLNKEFYHNQNNKGDYVIIIKPKITKGKTSDYCLNINKMTYSYWQERLTTAWHKLQR